MVYVLFLFFPCRAKEAQQRYNFIVLFSDAPSAAVLRKVPLLEALLFVLTVSLTSAVLFCFVFMPDWKTQLKQAVNLGSIQGLHQPVIWEVLLCIHFSAMSLIGLLSNVYVCDPLGS